MKKYIAIFTCLLAVFACGKENKTGTDDITLVRPTISASSENPITMATFSDPDVNGDCSILWSAGDKIGVHIYSGTSVGGINGYDKSWTLDPADAGQTSGSFTCDDAIDGSHNYSYAAYYPYGEDSYNIGGDARFYCAYKESYSDYVPGSLIAPMVANMNADGGGLARKSTDIALKHVGAIVKVTLNGVPAEANKIVLTISNNNITGWGSVNPTEAGSASIAPSGLSAGAGISVSHSVTLNFEHGSGTRDGLVFYFPVPVLTTPAIQLDLYGYDDVHIWTKSAAHNQSSVGRGEVLAMPALTVTPRLVYVLDDNVIGWGDSRNLNVYNGSGDFGPAFPGIWAPTTETIGGHTYYRFVLPVEADGQTCNFIFNKGEAGFQVNLPAATVSATPLYYRTNGILVNTVANPASPAALYSDVKIWAFKKNTTSDLNLYCYAFANDTPFWGTWQSSDIKMTKYTETEAKQDGGNWYYFSVPEGKRSTEIKVIFSFGGDGDSNQTQDSASFTANSNKYFGIDDNGGNKKWLWMP